MSDILHSPLPSLDPLLHQPIRTQIVAYLSGRGEATFSEMKRALEITDGNLGAHLNKLTEASFVETRNTTEGARAQTVFVLTESGRNALNHYVTQLSKLMQLSATGQTLSITTASLNLKESL